MAVSRGKRKNGQSSGATQLETGRLIDDFERSAQMRSSRNGITANLTSVGASVHGIEQSTPLTVLVFEEGIWITPNDDE